MQFEYDIKLDKQRALVTVVCRGALSDALQGEKVLRDVVTYTAQQGLKRILVDIRELRLSFSGKDMMDVMINMRDEKWLKGMRVARLLTMEDFSNLLIADISESMALPVKNFASELQAVSWLEDSQ